MKTQVLFLTVLVALLSISISAQAVEFGPDSANITNRYVPGKIGSWRYMLGVGTSVGSATYNNVVGIEEVSGAQIGDQTFNNVKCLKSNYMRTNNLIDEDEFNTVWMAQDTEGNVWIMKVYLQFADVTYKLGTIFKSMFMPAVPDVGDPASLIAPETANNYCRVVEVDIPINTNFGSYSGCIKINCVYDLIIESVEYFCPDFGTVRQINMDDGIPQDVLDLKEYGHVTNTRAEIIGTWDNGIWYLDVATSTWTQMTSYTTDRAIASGDFTGDGKADVASIWDSGLYYQDGDTGAWTLIDSNPPNNVAACDVTGDGRAGIIGTWSDGLWYWDSATSAWTKIDDSTPFSVTCGDITGN